MKKSLISLTTKSDKIAHHGYHRFYDRFLSELAYKDEILMLELGYENGYSINLWKEFFNNVKIHSIDIIDPPSNKLLDQYFKVNQDSTKELDSFVFNTKKKYDFIIDDASHVPIHQWNTFIRFINILAEGGIYIIEDTETSFWGKSEIFGYHFNSSESSIFHKVPYIIESINDEFIDEKSIHKNTLSHVENIALNQIESVTIGYNCVIITKKKSEDSFYYRSNDNYRHKKFINKEKLSQIQIIKRYIKNLITK